jgi:hypothetical protein
MDEKKIHTTADGQKYQEITMEEWDHTYEANREILAANQIHEIIFVKKI